MNQTLADAYIARDVTLRRVAAGVAKGLDEKIVALGHELSALTRRINPTANAPELIKMRRRKLLEKEGSALIQKRMNEMRVGLVADLKQIGVYEAKFARTLLEEALNGLL